MNLPDLVADLAAARVPDDIDRSTLLRTIAVAEGVRDIVNDGAQALRRQLSDRMQPGDTARLPGLATASRTAPTPTLVITDQQAFGGWVRDQMPDRATVVRRPDPAAIAARCAEDPVWLDRLAELDPSFVREETLLDDPDDLAERVAENFAPRDPDKPEQLRVGKVPDSEGVPIPGVEVRPASASQLRIVPDKKGRAALLEQLRTQLTGPTTTESDA